MDLHLEGKVILVTGGASGIGESICRQLAAEKAIPCALDRDERNLQRMAKDIVRSCGLTPHTLVTELTSPRDCEKAVAQVVKTFGRIDGLVNNAGTNDGVGLETGDYEGFMASQAANAGHYFSMAHYALPELKKTKGPIVNICSKTALTGQGGTSGYAAANGTRMGLTRQWAAELSAYDIHVNGVVVAECLTPQYERWLDRQPDPEARRREILSAIPLDNRMTTCEEVADTVIFLLSPHAGAVTGRLFFVDGGYVFLDRQIGP